MLENPGGIARFIAVFSCNSQAVKLQTSSVLRFQFCYIKQSFIRAGTCTHMGLSTSNNTATTFWIQSFVSQLGDLFCRGIDSVSAAVKGLKGANLQQIVKKTTPIVLVQRGTQVCDNQKKMEDDGWSLRGGLTPVCSSTKTIIPLLNTGRETKRPCKILH